jgi:EAL domain-containing protein (putative c-di-GMP-specific phosphodiesterase class I)
MGRNPRFLKSSAQSATFFDAMWAALGNGLPWVADLTNRRKDGSPYHLTSVISPIRAADGSIDGFVAVGRDVSHERELETRTEALTRERALIGDTLRRMPRGGTLEAAAEMFCRQVGSLTDIAMAGLIIFESDGAAVPLAYAAAIGRDVGLRRMPPARSRYLRYRAEAGPWVEGWRPSPGHPYNEVLRVLGIRAFAYAPVAYEGSVIGVLGVGSAEAEAMTQLSSQLGAVVDFADLAGALLGGRVGDSRETRRLRSDIETIITARAFTPAFQPIVDLMSGRPLGYEALTRFDDGVTPEVRFADAVGVGLGLELERATLAAAVTAASALSPSRFLHLNVSPGFVMARTELKRLLSETRARIVLEVTEHAAVGDYREFLEAIDGIGRPVCLAVDDAGAGFASFRHILELRPAFVKLDVSLVRGIDADPAKQALVAGMRYFARTTKRRLIAEGVETEAEAATLRRLEIRLGQGYLFGRPAALNLTPG